VPSKPASLTLSLGRRIAALRETCGLTQEKLAWEAGIESKGYLSRIESGQRAPSLVVLERLARRLEVEVRDLFIAPDRGAQDAAMELVRLRGARFSAKVVELGKGKP
jgi:transcriptional regulator with XRE-family HTH domain